METETGKLRQWHPAFYSAIQLELLEQKENLEYKKEYILNTKPIVADLVVIKKKANCKIQNEIGKLFLGHNLLEYKSPDDELNVDTYYKVLAYACLYKAQGEQVDSIKAEDVTITMIRERKPYKLFHFFREHRYKVEKKSPGLYYVTKDGFFDTQIIVTKELNRKMHIWLHSLSRTMDYEQLERLIWKAGELQGKEERELVDSVLSLAMQTSRRQFNRLKEGDVEMCKELWDFFKPEIENAVMDSKNEGKNEGLLLGERRGRIFAYRELGLSLEEIAEKMNLTVAEVQQIQ